MKFIAEMCQNHNGHIEILNKMVASAAVAGATHCKLQGLYSSELTDRELFRSPELSEQNQVILRPYSTEFARLAALDLSEEQESHFKNLCEENSVVPMITVFTHKGARRARELGFKSIKIASYDCSSYPLIEYVCEFASEIVISTGATTEGEVRTAVRILENSSIPIENQWFLHCISEYPTLFSRLNLNRLRSLQALHPNIGFSDHYKDTIGIGRQIPAKIAAALGASIIEQHFTVLDPEETKDGPISVNQYQVMDLIEFGNYRFEDKQEWLLENMSIIKKALGDGNIDPSVQEWKNRQYYRGRVASWRDGKQIFSWEKWVD